MMSTSLPFHDGTNNSHNKEQDQPVFFGASSFNSNSSRVSHITAGPAFETAVASYASRVLKRKSPPESAIDASVGPYVTSLLRSGFESNPDTKNYASAAQVEGMAEYDSLMELLEEHCNMSEEGAKSALHSIARAIVTGVFDDDDIRTNTTFGSLGSTHGFGSSLGSTNGFGAGRIIATSRYRSLSMGAENDYSGGRFRSLSMGAENDFSFNMHRNNNMNTNVPMSNSALFGETLTHEQRNGSLSQITDNSMIEEEPSFLFEEDEIPVTAEQRNSYSSLLNFNSNSNNNPTSTPMMMRHPMSPMFPYSSHTEEKDNNNNHHQILQEMPQSSLSFTPLKPDRLIPEDLLGFINDPLTPSIHKSTLSLTNAEEKSMPSPIVAKIETSSKVANNKHEEVPKEEKVEKIEIKENSLKSNTVEIETVDPTPAQAQANANAKGNKKKKNKRKDMDLAAQLFSRPRSRSIHDIVEKSPKLKPMTCPSADGKYGDLVQILMAMNLDICEEAAYEALLVSNADVNVAQHVIDGALSAPPVCRHMLHGGCYRSDCQFSHDVDGHTCLFWLKGRCGKRDTCKFMHGFSEKLLEGINVEELTTPQPSPSLGIKTTNLVEHNIKTQFSFPTSTSSAARCLLLPSSLKGNESSKSAARPHANEKQSTTPPPASEINTKQITARERSQSLPNATFSFASIASKGYSEKSSFGSKNGTTGNNSINSQNASNSQKEAKIVRIPQNLWNPFYNRSSNAFHISDPLCRYKEVSSSTKRNDVIDLHFQSIKTFPVVLSTVLPEKLRDQHEVWIVTGSGHHVNSNSHQKNGGVLENAVIGWLVSNEYTFFKGRDKNGYGGACLVRGRNR